MRGRAAPVSLGRERGKGGEASLVDLLEGKIEKGYKKGASESSGGFIEALMVLVFGCINRHNPEGSEKEEHNEPLIQTYYQAP